VESSEKLCERFDHIAASRLLDLIICRPVLYSDRDLACYLDKKPTVHAIGTQLACEKREKFLRRAS
jgi:hypothetical protein